MDGTVDLDAHLVPELVKRLQEKREEVQKELSELGQAPAELSELLRLCRGFERAFTTSVKSLETAFYIKEAFLGESGLSGSLRKLPVEKKFRLDVIRAIVREADGYQPHLVSPEKGLRRLVDECIQMAKDPVQTCVERVYGLLTGAARDAAAKALTALSTIEVMDMKTARLPAFERTVTAAANAALEEWRKDAMLVATALVEMESDYITSAFFRRAIANRAVNLDEMQYEPEEREKGSEEEDDEDEDDEDDESTDDDSDESPKKAPAPRRKATTGEFDPNNLKAGYLEKRIGEGSGRGAIPMESWKWQKRWFIFTDTKAMLYYFKSPDDPPNYRGAVNIRETLVEDLDAQGYPKAPSSSGGASLLIRISHKDPNKSIIKKHHSLVLRAPNAAEKFEWLARLKHASDGGGVRRPAPTPPRKGQPAAAAAKGGKGSAQDEDDVDMYKYSSLGPRPMMTISGRDAFNIGIGTAVPFFEEAKTLAPIPPWKYLSNDVAAEDRFDAYLEQLGQDCNEYTRVVLDTIQTEVPKGVVHCLVKRSTEQMLERLYNHITKLQPYEVSAIMEEDSTTVQRRAASQAAIADLDGASKTVQASLEAGKGQAKVAVPRSAVDMAGMWDQVERPKSAESRDAYGDYTPSALRSNSGRLLRPSVSVPNGASAATASPKEPSPTSSASPTPTRPPTPPGASATAAPAAPPQPVAPGAPSPRPRRRPPPAPPA